MSARTPYETKDVKELVEAEGREESTHLEAVHRVEVRLSRRKPHDRQAPVRLGDEVRRARLALLGRSRPLACSDYLVGDMRVRFFTLIVDGCVFVCSIGAR